ncbi:DUF692 domain-containing protein [Marinicella sp. S1101]|uniref:HvfB family MNIO-type RiPP peptide maturase n=1 Tax=Marinicella marina TaxID=2996016 RepID=UPI002260F30F|nr:DUF692 domain-containing protein [Marinicella marina]MCX7555084.1 DUF692 domain-containing protein [Marinicella marina]MDJ1141392.1 DUF692 domain-containing protein [Marinicella marina]
MKNLEISGAGIGLRRGLVSPFQAYGDLNPVQFMEVAPENWMTVGGKAKYDFLAFAEKYPMILHGLSLSIGGPDELNVAFVKSLKKFKESIKAPIYSEHLSYCTDGGQLYDLMPIPFTEEAANYVAERVIRVQDILGERMALENVSYYLTQPNPEMTEIEFINHVIKKADCLLHLDVNNIHVNSVNHRYDPFDFLDQLPTDRIAYIHVAGHYNEAEDLIVDTHGAAVIEKVWQILAYTYKNYGVFPTLLERDFNYPPVAELLAEVERISQLQQTYSQKNEQQAII